jgi:regulator of sigma D
MAVSVAKRLKMRARLYAQITELTYILLVFIDDFADMTGDIDREKLHTDLNALGEVLAARFELEDQILHAIRGV